MEWLMTYGWIILLILATIAIIWTVNDKEFDSSSQICLDRGLCIARNSNEAKILCPCKEWRPKTFCELCIDDWTDECDAECVCDEAKNLTKIWSKDREMWVTEIHLNDSVIVYALHKCTSVHEKNECEKGNPLWIWDCGDDMYHECDGMCHSIGTSVRACFADENGTISHCDRDPPKPYKPEVCREKIIADLNCAELMDYYENGRQCEGFINEICKYPKLKDGMYSYSYDQLRDYLLYQIMLKDCGVAA